MDGVNNAFCSSKEEYEIARLTTKCAGLQGKIESQAAEITELDALRNDAVLRLDKYKALCDQMGAALKLFEPFNGEFEALQIKALEAWRAMK